MRIDGDGRCTVIKYKPGGKYRCIHPSAPGRRWCDKHLLRARRQKANVKKCRPEIFNARQRAWYFKNKGILCVKRKEYLRGLPLETRRAWNRKARYGLTPTSFEALWIVQSGKCAICSIILERNGKFDIDHDHSTGAVRGILCIRCNKGIGYFKDSVSYLRLAENYLTDRQANGNKIIGGIKCV